MDKKTAILQVVYYQFHKNNEELDNGDYLEDNEHIFRYLYNIYNIKPMNKYTEVFSLCKETICWSEILRINTNIHGILIELMGGAHFSVQYHLIKSIEILNIKYAEKWFIDLINEVKEHIKFPFNPNVIEMIINEDNYQNFGNFGKTFKLRNDLYLERKQRDKDKIQKT